MVHLYVLPHPPTRPERLDSSQDTRTKNGHTETSLLIPHPPGRRSKIAADT